MSTLETKKKQLHHQIDAIEDEKLLQKIIDIVNEEGVAYGLTDEQKQRIERGRREVNEGKTITNDEAKKRTAEWLNEKK